MSGATPSVACGDTSPNVASLLGEETRGQRFSPQEGASATDVGGSAGVAGEGGILRDDCKCVGWGQTQLA